MNSILSLTEEDRLFLNRFYNISRIWKWVLISIIVSFCTWLLYMGIIDRMYDVFWVIVFLLVFGWFSYKSNQRRLLHYEEDLQYNLKIRATGRIINFIYEEGYRAITFCEEGQAYKEDFFITNTTETQVIRIGRGANVEIEYTPHCRFLLSVRPV